MLEFKPEHFAGSSEYIDGIKWTDAADVANALFKEWVDSCEVVRGQNNADHKLWCTEFNDAPYTARIFDIKEIESECSHEIKNYEPILYKDKWPAPQFRCNKCGKKLKPTGWEVVE